VLPGLRDPASAKVDPHGVPLIDAATLEDALRVEGFLHATDRFAQMDLLRRFAAGEIAELLGPLALAQDKPQRALLLRASARRSLAAMSEAERRWLEAYTEGVNAGLAALSRPPAEHRFLGAQPTAWRSEDSVLVCLAMAAMLNDGARVEPLIGLARESLPAEIFAFLAPSISVWDAPVIADDEAIALPAIPGPDTVDTRTLRSARSSGTGGDTGGSGMGGWLAALSGRSEGAVAAPIGSNGWVVSGDRTGHGHAILANDMHLPLAMPGIWYRVSLRYGPAHGPQAERTHRLDGISLPGVPGIVSGSNGHVAWGFTNVEGDFMDFVVLELDPADANRYRTPEGWEAFTVAREEIVLRGAEPQTVEVRISRWGPVIANDAAGRPLALKWTATEPGGVNIRLLELGDATTVAAALDIAAAWRGPQQNVMVAGRDGSIGWTISGMLPRRVGFDGVAPTSWADGARRWDGECGPEERPRVENPPEGFLVTANQRTLPLGRQGTLGRFPGEPDRAFRIRAALRELAAAQTVTDEAACAALQLDTATLRLARWRDALEPSLTAIAAERAADGAQTERAKRCATLAALFQAWDGRADAEEKAVAVVDRARRKASQAIVRGVLEASLAPLGAARDPAAADAPPPRTAAELAALLGRLVRLPASDESVLRIVEAKPAHLLPPAEGDWNGFLTRCVLEAAAESSGKDGLLPWGKVNAAEFQHALAAALPLLATKFGLAAHEQPGFWSAVRVATPRFGASDRLVVAPGREELGLIQTPGGQSGDPESPHYADLHPFWRDGRPLPLVPSVGTGGWEFVPVTGAASPPGT
jgi:penicillin amidase